MAYKIAIVIPFHNVNMRFFNECVASMHRQTIGFENVQWIIVVHNCEPHYLPELKEMFKNDSNVLLEELNDGNKTPSSPRNRGLELVDAPYVGLLDGDDAYTDDCLEVVLKEMEETQSDMVNVRREMIHDTEGLMPFTVKSLFNNTNRRTIMDNGHWDEEKLFGNIWGMCTAFFYRTSLLKENHIVFDEEMRIAEDFYFTILCIAHAKRICYLNQYIGYRYMMYAGSAVQKGKLPASLVLSYAKTYRKIMETMIKYGIDISQTFLTNMILFCHFMRHCAGMTREIRYEIKELLGDYVSSLPKVKVSKIRSEKQLDHYTSLICETLLNPEKDTAELLRSELDGMQELRAILSQNKNTDFGKRNSFDMITTLEGWQYRMPLTDAAFYKPLIDLQTRVGEKILFTTDPTTLYFKTTSGVLYPCTEDHLKPYHEAVASILHGHYNLFLAQSKPIEKTTIDEAVVDTLESALVKAYFKHDYFKNGILTAQFASTVEAHFLQKEETSHRLVLQCLADANPDQMVAFTCDDIVKFFSFIEQNWQQLIKEVPCTDSRRAELEAIFKGGFDQPIATQIWPNLKKIVAFGSGEHYQACNEMKKYTGDLVHNHGFYFTEEAILGKATEDGSELFECIRSNNFYELIPLAKDAAPVLWSQVEKGAPYQLVVTNNAGLYRYVTDHFICPQEITSDSIKFTIY